MDGLGLSGDVVFEVLCGMQRASDLQGLPRYAYESPLLVVEPAEVWSCGTPTCLPRLWYGGAILTPLSDFL